MNSLSTLSHIFFSISDLNIEGSPSEPTSIRTCLIGFSFGRTRHRSNFSDQVSDFSDNKLTLEGGPLDPTVRRSDKSRLWLHARYLSEDLPPLVPPSQWRMQPVSKHHHQRFFRHLHSKQRQLLRNKSTYYFSRFRP